MKRIVVLILSIALCLAIAVPALAEVLDADHECVADLSDADTFLTTGEYLNGEQCRYRYINISRCIYCNGLVSWYSFGETIKHDFETYHASCNGTTQTWNQRCSNCRTQKAVQISCPGAPHGGYCDFLPA